MRSCNADNVLIVCAFFAMSKSNKGMRSISKEVKTVGNSDWTSSWMNSCLFRKFS